MNDLQKLFVSELRDMYDAEQQLVTALSEMEESAEAPELKTAFRSHGEETRMHVNRLEKVFQEIGEKPQRKTCHGIEGIVDEGQMIAKEFKGNTALVGATVSVSALLAGLTVKSPIRKARQSNATARRRPMEAQGLAVEQMMVQALARQGLAEP